MVQLAPKAKAMKSNNPNKSSYSVYPGEYVPLFKEKYFNEHTKHPHRQKENNLSINIEDLSNCYKIELPVPGVKRENFLIKACGNILTVSVVNIIGEHAIKEKFQLHEFNFQYGSSRKIALPENADPVFINAEYKAGVLRLYIPKSKQPLKLINTQIVVY